MLLSMSKWRPDWSIGTFSAIGVSYLLLVRRLRWRRYDEVHRRFAGRVNYLTLSEALEIVSLSSNWDMAFGLAEAIAFMKTLAIPSTSKLLVKTGEMRSDFYTSKRLADTSILISTWSYCPLGKAPSSEKPGAPTQLDLRAHLAIAASVGCTVNMIYNDDYLYTISVFMLEFPRLAKRDGWRCLSPLECQARFVVWREIGTLMGVHDIPEPYEEFEVWAQAFEELHMIPAPSNHQCVEATLSASLYHIPGMFGLKALARSISVCILDD